MIPDSLRLALGTFTAVTVPPPRTVDRRTACGAMLWAPWVGLGLALVVAGVVGLVRMHTGGPAPAAAAGPGALRDWVLGSVAVNLLLAALAVGALAAATRFLHLDGLADTADALGVKGAGPELRVRRLAVMQRPDTGAFGAATLVLVLLVQVTAFTACLLRGHGTDGLLVAVVTGRLAATWATSRPVPAARGSGLGATVAGTVPVIAAAATTLAVLAGATVLGMVDDDTTLQLVLSLPVAVALGLAAGTAVTAWAVRALGGVTGDTLGAAIEIATATTLVATALLA